LDLKGSFYLKGSSKKYYLAALRDEYDKKVALKTPSNKDKGDDHRLCCGSPAENRMSQTVEDG